MFDYIKKHFNYTDYQIAQLRYAFTVCAAEISKAVIIGIFYLDRIPLFLWALFIFQIMRQATGGIHCKTYLSCLAVSFIFIVLSIDILPLLFMSRLLQLVLLLLCIIISHCIGPVISDIHMPLSQEAVAKAKLRLITIILVYMALLFIMPQNTYITVGFWVIILNTLQLIVARIRKEVKHPHET